MCKATCLGVEIWIRPIPCPPPAYCLTRSGYHFSVRDQIVLLSLLSISVARTNSARLAPKQPETMHKWTCGHVPTDLCLQKLHRLYIVYWPWPNERDKHIKNLWECTGIILTLYNNRSASQESRIAEGREKAAAYQGKDRGFLEEVYEFKEILSLGLGPYCSPVALFLPDFLPHRGWSIWDLAFSCTIHKA